MDRVEITEDEAWDEIDKAMQVPLREEGDYDLGYFRQKYGMKRFATETRLEQLVKDGVLQVREVLDNGTIKRVWRIVQK